MPLRNLEGQILGGANPILWNIQRSIDLMRLFSIDVSISLGGETLVLLQH